MYYESLNWGAQVCSRLLVICMQTYAASRYFKKTQIIKANPTLVDKKLDLKLNLYTKRVPPKCRKCEIRARPLNNSVRDLQLVHQLTIFCPILSVILI